MRSLIETTAELERFAQEQMRCINWSPPVGWSPDGELHFTEEDCRNWVCKCPRCKFLADARVDQTRKGARQLKQLHRRQ